MVDQWDRRFLRLAREVSTWSKDPSTKVGAVAVDRSNVVLSMGWNGFPRGMEDDEYRLGDREYKNKFIVHAEENCIINAGRTGRCLNGSVLYVYGLSCCRNCARAVVQAGIGAVVMSHPPIPDKWAESCMEALTLFDECGVVVELVDPTLLG